jgi:hypothetical protein
MQENHISSSSICAIINKDKYCKPEDMVTHSKHIGTPPPHHHKRVYNERKKDHNKDTQILRPEKAKPLGMDGWIVDGQRNIFFIEFQFPT